MLMVNNLAGFNSRRASGGEYPAALLAALVLGMHCEDSPPTDTKGHTVTTGAGASRSSTWAAVGSTYSVFFNGSATGYLTLDGSADFAFGTGDFCIRFKYRTTADIGTDIVFDHRPASTNGVYPTIYIDVGVFRFFTNSADRIVTTTSLANNTEYDVEVSRISGVTRMFINGTQEGGDYTDSNNYLNGTSRPAIGASGFNFGNGSNAYMDEIMVAKGYGWHSANFTPPTTPFG